MGYGVSLRNAQNELFFSTDTITWNYIGSWIADANVTSSNSFSVISLMSEVLIQRFFVDTAPGNQEAYVHAVSRSGTTVTATANATNGTVRTLVVVLGR